MEGEIRTSATDAPDTRKLIIIHIIDRSSTVIGDDERSRMS